MFDTRGILNTLACDALPWEPEVFFVLLLAVKIEKRIGDSCDDGHPIVTRHPIAASPFNFRRQQQEKKPSGTQGSDAHVPL